MADTEPADREAIVNDQDLARLKRYRSAIYTAHCVLSDGTEDAIAKACIAEADREHRHVDAAREHRQVDAAREHRQVDAARAEVDQLRNQALDNALAEVEKLRGLHASGCVETVTAARATIQRVKHAHGALIALRDKAAADADAGYRGSECYSDAYENADRLIRTALEEQP